MVKCSMHCIADASGPDMLSHAAMVLNIKLTLCMTGKTEMCMRS